jgi:hypothetical protein
MLKTNRSVKNCCFSNNGLPVDKICHLNLTVVCHPEYHLSNKYRPISGFQ